MRAVIFDIDGTVADITHRRHFVASKPKNWAAFNQTMHMDAPKHDIIAIMDTFRQENAIIMCSGRGMEWMQVTMDWLGKHGVVYDRLYMRPVKDYRADNIIKKELLDQIIADGFEPWLVFDDRDQVVKMWRENGITCCQVAEGNF